MLVMFLQMAFFESQELATSLTQQQDGAVHLLQHYLVFLFVFKGQGLGGVFWVCLFYGLNQAAWEKSLPY